MFDILISLSDIKTLGSNMPKVVTPLSNNQCKHAKAKDKEFTLSHGGGWAHSPHHAVSNNRLGELSWILTHYAEFDNPDERMIMNRYTLKLWYKVKLLQN